LQIRVQTLRQWCNGYRKKEPIPVGLSRSEGRSVSLEQMQEVRDKYRRKGATLPEH